MALYGVGWSPTLDSFDLSFRSCTSSTRLIRRSSVHQIGKTCNSISRQRPTVMCFSSVKNVSKFESKESVDIITSLDTVDEELEHVTKFQMSDLMVCDRISIGLGGRVCVILNVIARYASLPFFIM